MSDSSRLIATAMRIIPREDRDPRVEQQVEGVAPDKPAVPIRAERVGLLSLNRGSEVLFQDDRYIVEYPLDIESVALRHARTGRHGQASLSHLPPVPLVAERKDEPGPPDPALASE